jgi:hypothetical protein
MKKLFTLMIVGGTLVLAQSAAAADYCVLPNTSCASPTAHLEDAIQAAAASPEDDRIFLGSGTYVAPVALGFAYVGSSSVEIIGEGAGQTTLTSPDFGTGVLTVLGGPGSSVHDLTVKLPIDVPVQSYGLDTNGTAKRVLVTEVPGQIQGRTGVFLEDGGTLEDSRVEIGNLQTTEGVTLNKAGAVVRNSTVSANTGIQSAHGGVIERTRVNARDTGILALAGTTSVRDSLVKVSAGNSVGLQAQAITNGADADMDVDGVTLLGPGGLQPVGVFAYTGIASSTSVTLHNSLIRGFGEPLRVYGAVGGGTSTVTASYSDYDASGNDISPINSVVTESNITNAANPGFADVVNGDYSLLPSSPLVDAGDPASADGLDLNGKPRIVDGNGDRAARRDIGAFEFQPAPPPAPVQSDPPADNPPPAPTGTGAADTQAPLVSGFAASNKTFAVGRARTAVSAVARGTKLRYSLSEAAKVTITIRRVGSRRSAGKLVRSAKAGANVVRFSGRIGSRALSPGRYRAVLVATDAAGNHSAAKRVTFRVVRK